MPQKKSFFLVICLVFVLGILNTNIVFASTTDGTIDVTYKYAWGENIGWLNFGSPNGNVHITDSGMTGYAWSENYGWINLNANGLAGGRVTNNGNGVLGGNAWGEGLGWVSFGGVTIDANGVFSGYATIANDSSKISFNCSNTSSCGSSDFKVQTDWRPANTRPGGGGGGGGRILPPDSTLITTEEILGSGVCPTELIITDNIKIGARNGLYSDYNKGIVKQVAILQAHINRILSASYKEAAGPVDGIFGPLTNKGVERLQTALNTFLKPKPLLVIDGIIGPFTKAAINNSCGALSLPAPAFVPTPSSTPTTPTITPISPPTEVINPPQNIPKSGQVNVPPNVPKGSQPALQNTKPNLITKSINSVSTYINTYIMKPVIKTIVDIGSAIKTTITSFWHGFSAPIINLFK